MGGIHELKNQLVAPFKLGYSTVCSDTKGLSLVSMSRQWGHLLPNGYVVMTADLQTSDQDGDEDCS